MTKCEPREECLSATASRSHVVQRHRKVESHRFRTAGLWTGARGGASPQMKGSVKKHGNGARERVQRANHGARPGGPAPTTTGITARAPKNPGTFKFPSAPQGSSTGPQAQLGKYCEEWTPVP